MPPKDHLPAGWIFLVLLFLSTCFPDKSYGAVEVGSAVLYVSELAMLFLPFAYLLYPRRNAIMASNALRVSIITFFGVLGFAVIAKCIFYGEHPLALVRDIRHVLPLLICLALLYLGVRVRMGGVWAALLLGVSCSYLLSIVFFALNLDPTIISTKEAEIEVATTRYGRMVNSHGVLSIFFLSIVIAWKRKQAYHKHYLLVALVAVLSLGVSLMSFNRTLLVMYPVVFLVFLFVHFDIRKAFSVAVLIAIAGSWTVYSYNTDDSIRRQVDRRILSIQYGADALLEAGFYGTRDVMYERYRTMVLSYGILGAPASIPKSFAQNSNGEIRAVYVTDISVLTILLKFGVFSLMAFFWVLWRMLVEAYSVHRKFRRYPPETRAFANAFMMALIFYLPISLNIDVFTRMPPIFFLSMLLMFGVISSPMPIRTRARDSRQLGV